MLCKLPFDLHIDVAVVSGDFGTARMVGRLALGEGDDPVDQFPKSLILFGNHPHYGDAESVLQGVDVDADPLGLRHIDHIDGDEHRRTQKKELGKEIQAPFQGSGVG